jgi:hypothetical protein
MVDLLSLIAAVIAAREESPERMNRFSEGAFSEPEFSQTVGRSVAAERCRAAWRSAPGHARRGDE